ncbi:hypothetical protein PAPHI01_2691 [Pancytospora philotis]|nr:hypothetical protein PAPHI01_2691 [Pancytospora philotis]
MVRMLRPSALALLALYAGDLLGRTLGPQAPIVDFTPTTKKNMDTKPENNPILLEAANAGMVVTNAITVFTNPIFMNPKDASMEVPPDLETLGFNQAVTHGNKPDGTTNYFTVPLANKALAAAQPVDDCVQSNSNVKCAPGYMPFSITTSSSSKDSGNGSSTSSNSNTTSTTTTTTTTSNNNKSPSKRNSSNDPDSGNDADDEGKGGSNGKPRRHHHSSDSDVSSSSDVSAKNTNGNSTSQGTQTPSTRNGSNRGTAFK